MRKHNLNVPVQMPGLIRANVRVCYCQLSNVSRNLVFLPQSLRGKQAMTGKEALNFLHFCSQTKFSPEVLIGMGFMVQSHHRRPEVLLGYKQSISDQHIRTLAKLSKTT